MPSTQPSPWAVQAPDACLAPAWALVRSSGTPAEAVSKAVAQSFSDCRGLPADQSCDSVAQAQAKVGDLQRLGCRIRASHSWRRVPAV